jgi:aspartate aminotransferase/aminotransferase
MSWLAQRTAAFDASGIRKVFDLAAKMENPINLSIGQPDFDVPEPVKAAAIEAIRGGRNGYSPTQGIAELRERLEAEVVRPLRHDDRRLLVTSGTSGGLLLAMLALVDPGDEVILFDPYFVMYPALVRMVGGTCVFVDTYPDFRIDVGRVAAAITPKTKLILANSPANPTGSVASRDQTQALAQLAAEHHVALISDEIYRTFVYDGQATSAAEFNDQTIVIDGFSKTYGMTGWRLGYVHGPAAIIDKMTMLQQYTFVCAPHPLQWAAAAALDVDMHDYVAQYKKRRDLIVDGLKDHFELTVPGGAFYVFPKAPWGTGSQFVEAAIREGILVIPGNIFSRNNSHFRISYAASLETIERGVDALGRLAMRA